MTHSNFSLARRLKLQQVAIFDKVVNCGSILAASSELHMTQPALTKSIHEMEKHFGQALFTRSKRGMKLTEFGRLLQRHVQTLLADLRFLADDINAWDSGVSGRVVVGALFPAAAKLLPRSIVRLQETAPNVVVNVQAGSNEVLFPELVRGSIDVVVGFLPSSGLPNTLGLRHVSLYSEALCVVVARNHEQALNDPVDLQALIEMAWIIPSPESAARRSAQLFFDEVNLQFPKRIVESSSFLTNLGLLMESSMVALFPRTVAEHFVRLGLLAILPIRVSGTVGNIGYTLFAQRTPSAAAQRLLLILEETAASIAPS